MSWTTVKGAFEAAFSAALPTRDRLGGKDGGAATHMRRQSPLEVIWKYLLELKVHPALT